MADVELPNGEGGQPPFTCLSCSIAFLMAEEQRDHYRSDHHRYNMKRRVASLPPVSVAIFNQKVLERRQETAVMLSPKGSTCEVCKKSYTTDNAYRSHMNSKKHKENELKAASRPIQAETEEIEAEVEPEAEASTSTDVPVPAEPAQEPTPSAGVGLSVSEDATEDEVTLTLDQKIAAARSRLSPAHCLFCATESGSLDANLTHMSTEHSFFIPDAEYLVDITGLITYFGEKIAVGNVCIYCNGRGREFRTLDAVRKHMLDKSHCKIAYDEEKDRLEISDFYDFSASYPDAEERAKRKAERAARRKEREEAEAVEGWEDAEDVDDGAVDEVIEEDASSPEESGSEAEAAEDDSDDDSLLDEQITYACGATTRSRSPAPPPRGGRPEDPNSGAAIVRRLLADKNSALVPRKGGFGAFGTGTEVIKARNRGEAREAGRHVREFRDQKRREDFKTRVGFIHNSQKYYRDPLLQ
ncbi:hypothetical protein EVG20_g5343 [Dentipellis fragilis]|uniref:C2H2-type domain-containing protein n=1 Tax=Dentipellis fragilis TaxID=205917 RepID=A0A4Y9YVQ3_9AGAM|nr:hypothetical protein EVG20_g5343 [Dentipellis fragilis]